MLAIQRFSAIGAIDAAFRLYRQHFKTLFLISLIVNVPTTLTNVMLAVAQHGLQTGRLNEAGLTEAALLTEMLPTLLIWVGVFVVAMIVAMIAATVGMAAGTAVASASALGEPIDVWRALKSAQLVFWTLLGATLLASLAIGFGFLFCFVPGVIFSVGFALVSPVVVVERRSAFDALSRSWFLTTGRRWKILGASTLVFLIVGVASAGLVAVLQIVPGMRGTLTGQVVQTLLSQAISAIGTPVWWVVIVLLYYDGRVAHEAFDVEALARSAALPPAPSASTV
jgi:hypothetical protein